MHKNSFTSNKCSSVAFLPDHTIIPLIFRFDTIEESIMHHL